MIRCSSRDLLELFKIECNVGHGFVWSRGGRPPWTQHRRVAANTHWPGSQQPVILLTGCLRIELFCREMDQPLTRPPCFSLAGVVLLSAMNGLGLLGVGWTHHDRYDKPRRWSEAGKAVMLLKRSQDWAWSSSNRIFNKNAEGGFWLFIFNICLRMELNIIDSCIHNAFHHRHQFPALYFPTLTNFRRQSIEISTSMLSNWLHDKKL